MRIFTEEKTGAGKRAEESFKNNGLSGVVPAFFVSGDVSSDFVISGVAPAASGEESEFPKQPYMASVCRMWLREIKNSYKNSTYVRYESDVRQHIIPAFGFMRTNEVRRIDIVRFVARLLSGNSRGKFRLSGRSVTGILSRLRSIKKFAVSMGYIVNYTTDNITVYREKSKKRALTREEQKKLLSCIVNEFSLYRAGIMLSLFTGMRIGEICALKWSDISLDDGIVYVSRTLQRVKDPYSLVYKGEAKTYIDIGLPKSESSVRAVPVSEYILDLLERLFEETGCNKEAYFLTGREGLFVEPRIMQYHFKRTTEECGIEGVTFHALRHTFATNCISEGADASCVSEMLGHTNLNITLSTYVHPEMSRKRETVNRVSDIITVE